MFCRTARKRNRKNSQRKLTDGQLGVTFLAEAHYSAILAPDLGELHLAELAELVAQRLPRAILRQLQRELVKVI